MPSILKGDRIPRIAAREILLAVLLGLFIPAAASAAAAARPESPAAGSAATTQAAAGRAAKDSGTSPMEDKFRKLQEEMSQENADRDGPSSTPTKAPAPRGLVSLSFQVLLGLAFVLLLAVAGIRLLKRLQGRMLSRPGAPAGGGDLLEILETCHLGQNQRVVALRINDEVGVVGVTPSGITLLTVLKQPAEEIRRTRMGPGNAAAFSDSLNKLLDRFKKPKRVSDLLDEA